MRRQSTVIGEKEMFEIQKEKSKKADADEQGAKWSSTSADWRDGLVNFKKITDDHKPPSIVSGCAYERI